MDHRGGDDRGHTGGICRCWRSAGNKSPNPVTLIRIKANDDWNYYQAKSIKSSLLDAKIYSAQLNKVEPRKADTDKKAEYAVEMPEIQKTARELEKLSKEQLETHET